MPDKSQKVVAYRQLVENKFQIYNSLFLNLPYEKIENIGLLLPLLRRSCADGFASGSNPVEIVDHFFEKHTDIISEKDKIDFFFRLIQYIERQIVLFDSIEDAGFTALVDTNDGLNLEQTIQSAINPDQRKAMFDKLMEFGVRLVFTAHPTQFYPLSVLDIIAELREAIKQDQLSSIDQLLQQLGMTSFLNSQKPTPIDEARNIIYYLRYVYYDAAGNLFKTIKEQLADAGDFTNYNLIQLGFWPGGDRDGNPFVTAAITRQVVDELRVSLMKCYYNDLKALMKKLTFKEVTPLLTDLRNKLYKAMFDEDYMLSYATIHDALSRVHDLILNKYNGLYIEELELLLDKVRIFKVHFATLDIRQDSSVHLETIKAILQKHNISDNYDNLPVDQRIDLLLRTELILDPSDYSDELIKDTIVNITQLADIQRLNGEEGCCRYIISNSEDIFAVLHVHALFRWCGWETDKISFDIVPLFETMVGMRDSKDIMDKLFTLPVYRDHVKRRGDRQTMMLGFSDGTKDGGYLKANWSIYLTKERLTSSCTAHGVVPLFFDGRGGPPARGGGKSARFYASQGPDIANEEVQLTIQGQTITSTYGTQEQYAYNMSQLISSGLQPIIDPVQAMTDSQRSLFEHLSEWSFEKYDALKHHPDFIPYLEQMSTLKYYSRANIGSRPGKRGARDKPLTLKDLRAISFVGSWSQLKQNVPGYYGVGSALKRLEQEGRLHEAKALFNDVPFFKALILNCMMSLTKSYFPLTSYMSQHPQFGDFWQMLYDEYELTVEMLLKISGYDALMDEEIISRTSIYIREEIVLPLLAVQQYALQKVIEGTSSQDLYEKIVTRSLYGNINAARNSA